VEFLVHEHLGYVSGYGYSVLFFSVSCFYFSYFAVFSCSSHLNILFGVEVFKLIYSFSPWN